MMYAFKLPSVRENVTIRGTAAVSVPDETAAVPIVNKPDMFLGPLLFLKD